MSYIRHIASRNFFPSAAFRESASALHQNPAPKLSPIGHGAPPGMSLAVEPPIIRARHRDGPPSGGTMSPEKNIDPSVTTTNGFCRLVAELFASQEAFAQFHQLPKAARLEVLARFSSPITSQQIDSICCRMARWRSRRSTANKN